LAWPPIIPSLPPVVDAAPPEGPTPPVGATPPADVASASGQLSNDKAQPDVHNAEQPANKRHERFR